MLGMDDFEAWRASHGIDAAREQEAAYEVAFAPGRSEAERLSELPPGPELAAGLLVIQAMLLDQSTQVLVYASWQRMKAWVQAQSMPALIAAAGPPSTELAKRSIPDVARQANMSEAAVGSELAQAWHTRDALPETWEALSAGHITPAHARRLHDVTWRVDAEITRQVEEAVLSKAVARRWTAAKLADAARAEVLRLDPEGAAARATGAKKTADVSFRPEEDEMATISAYGDAWSTRQFMDEINRRADEKQQAGDQRSVGERRIAALSDALLGEDVTAEPGDGSVATVESSDATRTKQPKRMTGLLLVDLRTVLGGCGPAHLGGYGPITAETARRIAASDIRFRRLVFDPLTSKPVAVSPDTYELDAETRRWVDVRDRECRFPGCCRRAVYCDADHGVEFPQGKTTCDNCGLLCRKHHNLKTQKWWQLKRNADDSVDWTSPLGFRYHVEAATYEEFADLPDPPDPWSMEEDSTGDDPPYVDDPWSTEPPPPGDSRDIDYDRLAWFRQGNRCA